MGKYVLKTVPITTNNITTAIINFLNEKGHKAVRINTQGQWDSKLEIWRLSGSTNGVTDIICCLKPIGKTFVIEVKFKGDTVKSHQKDFMRDIVECGGIAYIAKTYDSFVEFYNTEILKLLNNGTN